MPEHSPGMNLVPQIMSNQAESFLHTVEKLKVYGYEEVNLNLGCPSKTVVSKGRGSGFLADPDGLDRFLDEIFKKCDVKISIKTRIGKDDPEEFVRLLDIYNQYPVEELIIHPRVREELYRGKPHYEIFRYAMEHSKNPLCYNGDIVSMQSYVNLLADWKEESDQDRKKVTSIMLGRGVLKDPALIEKLAVFAADGACGTEAEETDTEETDGKTDRKKLLAFHDRLLSDYEAELSGDKNVLFKMKELWAYLIFQFPGKEKEAKAIRKAQRLSEYRAAVRSVFAEDGDCRERF